MTFDRLITTDVLVVGSGISGLTAALAAAPARVVVATKGPLVSGSTPWAQGGIAAPIGQDDSSTRHGVDTLAVGGGHNDPKAVDVLTGEAAEAIRALVAAGVRFDREADGAPALAREAGHSLHRVLHADGDSTGAEISRALAEATRRAEHVTCVEYAFVADLVVSQAGVVGATLRTQEGERVLVSAGAVVLATGGIGRVYANTTNPPEVTGDGLAMGARIGAGLADLEFVQFHPTALAGGGDPMPLLTEALRGEGAVLLDGSGRRFMLAEHQDAELAPRDVVARAIWRRVVAGEEVVLDSRDAVGEAFPDRFPTVFSACIRHGIDPRRAAIPVAPAAHYHMGGVAADLLGRSTVPGLWVVGEAARTGVHGANRLASNSLLEGAVFGARAGRTASDAAAGRPAADPKDAPDPGPEPDPQPDVIDLLREVMWTGVGVMRTGEMLQAALDDLERLDEKTHPGPSEARSLIEAARLVAAAALARPESCGAHYRSDPG